MGENRIVMLTKRFVLNVRNIKSLNMHHVVIYKPKTLRLSLCQ